MRSILCYFQQQSHILKLWAIRLMTEENNTTDRQQQSINNDQQFILSGVTYRV